MQIIHGSNYLVLHRVDNEEGSAEFKKLQGISWHEYVYDQEVFAKSYVYPSYHKYVVFCEPEDPSFFYHILCIEDGEHLDVLSDGRRIDDGHIFTSEPRTFIRLVRNGKVQAVLVTNDSPFDLDPNETDDYESYTSSLLGVMNMKLEASGLPTATIENTLFVSQL